MTQEEKAKAYDDALEIAKKNYVTAQDLREGSQIGVECFKNTLESIFPELKESEDEKIRKDIATFIFNYKGDIKDRAKWMNYLGVKVSFVEKQDKQKNAWSEDDENMVKDIIASIDALCYHGMVNWLKSLKERIG